MKRIKKIDILFFGTLAILLAMTPDYAAAEGQLAPAQQKEQALSTEQASTVQPGEQQPADESAQPCHAEPIQAEPIQAEPVQVEPVQVEPVQVEPDEKTHEFDLSFFGDPDQVIEGELLRSPSEPLSAWQVYMMSWGAWFAVRCESALEYLRSVYRGMRRRAVALLGWKRPQIRTRERHKAQSHEIESGHADA
ncbi:MAG: hypothetical protein M1549_02375 [Candidatus Dependentiae bacterium]|nr:hypothetical protein [Candidatus Dependentiae bacterium]